MNQWDQVIFQGLDAHKTFGNVKIRSAPVPFQDLEAGQNHPLPWRLLVDKEQDKLAPPGLRRETVLVQEQEAGPSSSPASDPQSRVLHEGAGELGDSTP